ITERYPFIHKQPFTGFFPMLNIIIALFIIFKRKNCRLVDYGLKASILTKVGRQGVRSAVDLCNS
ncbi:MAG: hypothetical protein WAU61_15095, partial [Smithella sp.]